MRFGLTRYIYIYIYLYRIYDVFKTKVVCAVHFCFNLSHVKACEEGCFRAFLCNLVYFFWKVVFRVSSGDNPAVMPEDAWQHQH